MNMLEISRRYNLHSFAAARPVVRVAKSLTMLNEPSWLRSVVGVEGMISPAEAKKLYALAKDVHEGCIVEVGSYRGRSTCALAYGSAAGHQAPIYAFDPHEEFQGVLGGAFGPEDRGAFYRAMLRTGAYRLVRLLNIGCDVVAPQWKEPVNLLWIDGDHSYEGVKQDVEHWRPHLMDGAVVAFDDSVDEDCGPYRLIQEITVDGAFERIDLVGKVSVLRYHHVAPTGTQTLAGQTA